MSKLTLSNMLGQPYFEHDFQPGPTIVLGPNSAGKSSIAVCLAAVTAQLANPLGLMSAQRKLYVTKGAAEGSAGLDDGRVLWTGQAIAEAGGAGPDTLPHAVGMVNFLASYRTAADAAKPWEALFLPEDPREILEPKWTFPKPQLDALVKQIEDEGGWDGALRNAQEEGRHAKREWRKYTNENWGKAKAKTWKPAKWREVLAEESEESLTAKLADVRDARQRLSNLRAVSADEIARARRYRDVIVPERTAELKEARLAETVAKDAMDDAQKAHGNAIGKANEARRAFREAKAARLAKPPAQCPSCGAGLEAKPGGDGDDEFQVVLWTPPEKSVEELDAAIAELADEGRAAVERQDRMEEAAKARRDAYSDAVQKVHQAEAALRNAQEQTAKADDAEGEGADEAEVERLRNEEIQIGEDLLAFKTKRAADRAAANVAHHEEVIAILGPTGARAGLMQQWMAKVRQTMASLCGLAGWLPVEVLRDYSIVSDGIAMPTCAENEQIKAQWLCQIGIAYVRREQCGWIVLDRADRLKYEDWEGLVRLVTALCHKAPHLRVVVCATDKGELAPTDWDVIQLEGRARG